MSNEEARRVKVTRRPRVTPTTPPPPTHRPAGLGGEPDFEEDSAHGARGIYVEKPFAPPRDVPLKIAIGCAITCRKNRNLSPESIGACLHRRVHMNKTVALCAGNG